MIYLQETLDDDLKKMIDQMKDKSNGPATAAGDSAVNSASLEKLSTDIQKFLQELDEKIEAKYNEYYGKQKMLMSMVQMMR